MKTATVLYFCVLIFGGVLTAQTQPTEKSEPQDLQLSKSHGTTATPRQEANWPPAGKTPRASDGHPDLSGNWQPNAIRENVEAVELDILSRVPDEALAQAAETLHALKETLLELLGGEPEGDTAAEIDTLV